MQLDTHDKGAEPHLAHRQNFNDFVVTRGAKLTLRELIESMDEIAFNELRGVNTVQSISLSLLSPYTLVCRGNNLQSFTDSRHRN